MKTHLHIFTARKCHLRRLCFIGVCVSIRRGCYPNMYCRWYPSMPCRRSPVGWGLVSQHAMQVSRPTPKGAVHRIWSRPTAKGKLRGIWSRPTPKGKLRGIWPGGACFQRGACSRWACSSGKVGVENPPP